MCAHQIRFVAIPAMGSEACHPHQERMVPQSVSGSDSRDSLANFRGPVNEIGQHLVARGTPVWNQSTDVRCIHGEDHYTGNESGHYEGACEMTRGESLSLMNQVEHQQHRD